MLRGSCPCDHPRCPPPPGFSRGEERAAIIVTMDETVRYTYRLRPGAQAEASLLAEWHRTRWLWNQSVAMLNETGKWVSDNDLTAWRKEHEWLRDGSSVAQQQELRNFRAKRAKGKGRRKFKSARKTLPSLNYTLRGFSLKDGRLRIAGGLSIPVMPRCHRENRSEQ